MAPGHGQSCQTMLVLQKDSYRCRTLTDLADNVGGWKAGLLFVRDFYTWKDFSVNFSFETTEPNAVLCRPVKPYEDNCFEQFFQFGGHCHGFTNQRVVMIKNIDIYSDIKAF